MCFGIIIRTQNRHYTTESCGISCSSVPWYIAHLQSPGSGTTDPRYRPNSGRGLNFSANCFSPPHHHIAFRTRPEPFRVCSVRVSQSVACTTHGLLLLVQCRFTSVETIRTIRDREHRTATSTFTQLLSSDDCFIVCFECCF